MHMLHLFLSVSGDFQAQPIGWNMNYSALSRFQWIRLDANILEMMPRKTEEKKGRFGTCGHGLSVGLITSLSIQGREKNKLNIEK